MSDIMPILHHFPARCEASDVMKVASQFSIDPVSLFSCFFGLTYMHVKHVRLFVARERDPPPPPSTAVVLAYFISKLRGLMQQGEFHSVLRDCINHTESKSKALPQTPRPKKSAHGSAAATPPFPRTPAPDFESAGKSGTPSARGSPPPPPPAGSEAKTSDSGDQ